MAMILIKNFAISFNNIVLRRHRKRVLTVSIIIIALLPIFILSVENGNSKRSLIFIEDISLIEKKKFAYVFYVTSSIYSCYALINVHRLIIDLGSDPNIDIVLLATAWSGIEKLCPDEHCGFPSGRVKIRPVSKEIEQIGRRLTYNWFYMDCYVRFEAFKLYDQYERIIVLDADGLILRNIDHLFHLDLDEFDAAAVMARADEISSHILLVKTSKSLYEQFFGILNNIRNVSETMAFSFDMDVINYAYKRGKLIKQLSKYYDEMDRYFFEEKTWNDINPTPIREGVLDQFYYVHFSIKKPLEKLETRPWPLHVNSADANYSWITETASKTPLFVQKVHYPFWTIFDQRCRVLVRNVPLIKVVEEGFSGKCHDLTYFSETIHNTTGVLKFLNDYIQFFDYYIRCSHYSRLFVSCVEYAFSHLVTFAF